MADAETETEGRWKKRESLPSAILQILLVGAILGGAVFFVIKRGNTRKEVGEIMREARTMALRGNPADLKAAMKKADEALELDSGAADPVAFKAWMYTRLWLYEREPGADAKAKEFLEKAKQKEAETEERFTAEAVQLVAAGQAEKTDAFIEGLFKRGASRAGLFYAKALALKSEGNLVLAHTGFTTALDKAWKDPFYATMWGEATLDETGRGAVDAFNKSLGNNPDYYRGRLGVALARVLKGTRVGEAENIVADVLAKKDELSPALHARALAIRAGIANIQLQPDQAIAAADEAMALNPDDAWALHFKAAALAEQKDVNAAAAFDAAVARARTAPAQYFLGARALQKAGALDQALALLDKYETTFKAVKNQTPEGKEEVYLDRDDTYWLARGDILKDAEKVEEAFAAYDKAIAAQNINLARANYAKAALYLQQKDYDNALKLLADITPPDGTGHLPEAYMAMGDVLFAKKEFGPGCQSFAYALTRMKVQQKPREELNQILVDVEQKLKDAGQKPIAKVWMEEAKPLIQ